ncbi:MAG: MBL fold metallo-hydrolase [Anaerolineae bacterium]|nr:MBL fold metallo-hydrolase [Anaerolineae bacterium]
MILKYVYDERLAQASYLVGCAATGEALVIDPARDITPYLALAEKDGLRITHVTETHIHADFVSGSRELAAATGATIYLSDMGTADWKYAYAGEPNVILVRDGDSFMVGNVRIQVMHTPGHTPEHISFMLTDTAGADRPMGIFTGDFIFAGDVGRPDLLEAAAGMTGTKEPGARQQFASVQRFKALPDYLQIWPGHGAGSACGKALGAVPSTTLGYEKLFNPAFQFDDEDAFVRWLLDGQPEAPRYFAQMKKVNKLGPALLNTLPLAAQLDRAALDAALQDGALVVDLRSQEEYERAHVLGTISIPATSSNFSTYIGWFVDFERPLYLIVPSEADADELIAGVRAIGVDYVGGYFTPDVIGQATLAMPVINARDLALRLPQNGLRIIDVRGKSEYTAEHIVGAQHIALGYLPQHLQDIPRDTLVVLQCASGYRSQIAASYLRARGFDNVVNLTDGHEVWAHALPTEAGA